MGPQPLILTSRPAASPKPSRWRRRIPTAHLAEFTRGFAVMIEARLSITQALAAAVENSRSSQLSAVLNSVRADVERGLSLAAALERQPDTFDRLFVQLVRVGESAGALSEILNQLATYLEKSAALRRKVRLALAYPAVVLSVAAGAVAFLLAVIVPTFAEMFADFGAELPAPTRIVLAVSSALTEHLLAVLVVLVGMAAGFRYARATAKGQEAIDRLLFRLPVLGSIFRKSAVARFCRMLATQLRGGADIVEALSIVEQASGNVLVAEDVRRVREAVARGAALAAPLRSSGIFPEMVVQMIAVGEETAQLDEMLFHVAQHHEREVDGVVDALTSVIEPVLIVVLGLIIGSILVAMYLPMFDMIHVVQ